MVYFTLARCLAFAFIGTLLFWPGEIAAASAEVSITKGQTVYVPVYSNVYSGPRKRPLQLATMLSIRNVDPAAAMKITTIEYFDNDGRFVSRHITAPLSLGPLSTHHVYLEEKDKRGGFGASFIVRWGAEKPINAPIIECVMIGASGGQGISFVSPGQEIRE